jgi:hypothetical protein
LVPLSGVGVDPVSVPTSDELFASDEPPELEPDEPSAPAPDESSGPPSSTPLELPPEPAPDEPDEELSSGEPLELPLVTPLELPPDELSKLPSASEDADLFELPHPSVSATVAVRIQAPGTWRRVAAFSMSHLGSQVYMPKVRQLPRSA